MGFVDGEGNPAPRLEPLKVAERGLSALLPVPVQEITLHPPPPVYRGIERGGGALVLKPFCILPGPERGGGRMGIVFTASGLFV
jgi:hypothetical protein